MNPTHLALAAAVLLAGGAAAAQSCRVESGPTVPRVVELYTSEGCNSCPPADRWLATVKGRPDVVALAFHVDYWDRLGWTDRFASPAWTQRQYDSAARNRSRSVYTPQVLLDGRDYRGWPALAAASAAARVKLTLVREGSGYAARVERLPGAPQRLAALWAVTEDGHRSDVRSGENRGVTLHHDAVVRELRGIAELGEAPLRFEPKAAPDALSGPRPRQVKLIVSDAETGATLQAVKLGC